MLCNKKIVVSIVSSFAVWLLLPGCYKDRTIYIDTTPEITKAVSFSADIIPLFTKNCSLSGCHSSGGKAPDLTAANAWNALKTGNYLSTSDPVNSTIMLWLTGKKPTQMPVGGINKDINAYVLAWIKQGAKNN